MLKTGDIFNLVWNGKPFYDHPPMGFWLMAISYKVFGISEFSTRLPSVITGLLAVVLVYKTAILIFKNRVVAVVAGLMLGTSAWFVLRVRSGNLDAPFVFFYMLTVYSAIKARVNYKYFIITMLSFAALLLTKTLVGVSALLIILLLVIKNLFKSKNIKITLIGVFLFLLLLLPWYLIQFIKYPNFYSTHFIQIGMRSKTLLSYFKLNYSLPLFYLHMGVRKWYYLWLLGLFSVVFTLWWRKYLIFVVLLWNALVLYPFLTTDQTHIWHLIPVYLPMALIMAGGVYRLGYLIFSNLKNRWLFKTKPINMLISINLLNTTYLVAFVLIALIQVKGLFNEVVPGSKYIPDDVAISKKAANYNKPLYLDDDFLPIAVYYSGKQVNSLIYLPDNKKNLVGFYQNTKKDNFMVVTRNYALDNLNQLKIQYKIIDSNNSFSIITR
jgi:4-amino-4-deoxy-L-arabinose transferase-like glycosyltransferase